MPSSDLRDSWLQELKQATKQRNIKDYYQKENLLGKGSFGKVYKALNKGSNKKVAIKKIRKEGMKDTDYDMCMNEIEILKVVSHNNVIKLIDTFEDEKNFYLVQEYVDGGSL